MTSDFCGTYRCGHSNRCPSRQTRMPRQSLNIWVILLIIELLPVGWDHYEAVLPDRLPWILGIDMRQTISVPRYTGHP